MTADRTSRLLTISITNDIATCTAIDASKASALAVLVPAGVTELTYHASATAGGTYAIVNNVATAGVDTVAASKWHNLPAGLLAFANIKILGNAAGGSTSATLKR